MADIIITSGRNYIAGLDIDCAISESHSYSNEVTEYPVESGSTISDNIRPKPIELSMECMITNSPLQHNTTITPGRDPVWDAYLYFKDNLLAKREPVVVRTTLRTYDDMAIESVSIPRSKQDGAMSLHFTVQLKQIIVVTNRRSPRRVSNPSCSGREKVGPKALRSTNLITGTGEPVYVLATPGNGNASSILVTNRNGKTTTVGHGSSTTNLLRTAKDPSAVDTFYDQKGIPHEGGKDKGTGSNVNGENFRNFNDKTKAWWNNTPNMPTDNTFVPSETTYPQRFGSPNTFGR